MKTKKYWKKYKELWDEIKNEIETINGGKTGKYGKDVMKIKLDTGYDLPLSKPLKFPTMTIVDRSVFEEEGKSNLQVYLDESLYDLQMLEYDRIDISEGININKTSASKECDVCRYWHFKDIGFKHEPYLCNGCHDLMQKAMNFNDVAIASAKGSD